MSAPSPLRVGFDWDGDGDLDIVSGNTAGYVEWFENLSGPRVGAARWAAPRGCRRAEKRFAHPGGSERQRPGPREAKWGYTTLNVADWDADGLPDLVVNSIWGRVEWLRNVGTRNAPQLAEPQPIEVAWTGQPPKPAWTWWKPLGRQLVTQWRTTPVVHDFNGDGLADLAMLDTEGYLAWFERRKAGDALQLAPPQRIFRLASKAAADASHAGEIMRLNDGLAGGAAGASLCLCDWDGDGQLDLFTQQRQRHVLPQHLDRRIAVHVPRHGHAGLQATGRPPHQSHGGQLDRDGKLDLLIGAEDGFFYYQPKPKAGERE